ncbi:actin-binding protein IPP-like [Drosophila sulfurigaster albostrigata]|uniref:actin-binding protein IPP-like n=1 Tax=Drosophila sulfurigaster albostrigata TaxID=89887 RepID=UPI002D218FCE|nr:actin-binding protein IPP-like [Drosophila sulfurigaster albostrigata]
MSEQSAKQANGQANNAFPLTADEIEELKDTDMEMFRKIEEICAPNQQGNYARRKATSMKEMGYEFDMDLECNLVFSPEKLEKHMIELIRNRKQTDIKVVVHGHSFKCHQMILQLYTNYFKNVTVFESAYINSDSVTPLGFELAYEWMTKMELVPQRDHIVDLYMAARFLEMPELEELLSHDFQNRELFDGPNAFDLFVETLPFEETPLQQLMLTRVSHYFLSAVGSREFCELNEKQVHAMLSSNVAGVNSELEIFMSAVRWFDEAWHIRKEHIEFVITAVRFQLMPPWALLSLKATQTHPLMKLICEHPFVMERINAGLSTAVTQRVETELDLKTGSDREWIIDEQAAHHHVYKCPNWQLLSYTQFDSYLKQVSDAGPLFHTTLKARQFANLMACCQAKYLEAPNTSNTD